MTQRTLFDFPSFLHSHKGEGSHVATDVSGANQWQTILQTHSAKCGEPPPMSCGSKLTPKKYTVVQKRSYKRACRRALLHGIAGYHGKVVTPADFPADLVSRIQQDLQPIRVVQEGCW